MIWSLDTSVLVATLLKAHPRHSDARRLQQRAEKEKIEVAVCAHALAETFSVLTRLPIEPLLRPSDAEILVQREVADRCRVVPVDGELESLAIAAVVAAGLHGGAVHDALHVVAARRMNAKFLWTLNRKHFIPFWDELHVPELPMDG